MSSREHPSEGGFVPQVFKVPKPMHMIICPLAFIMSHTLNLLPPLATSFVVLPFPNVLVSWLAVRSSAVPLVILPLPLILVTCIHPLLRPLSNPLAFEPFASILVAIKGGQGAPSMIVPH